MWPTATAVERPNEGNVRMLRAGVIAEEITEEEAAAILGKSPFEAQGKVRAWPTPTKQDGENCAGPSQWNRNSDPLNVAVLRGGTKTPLSFPTPSSNNGTGGATGLAGGAGNRKKLYKMFGEEEGKKLGCQSLNPSWVEWLMGWPVGWTDSRPLATVRFQRWQRQHGIS